ncbi:MAG: hypothetical protein ABEK16_05270 [Candidatus Nanohalobium sp.]
MKQKTLDRINKFYAKSLGCTPELMENPRSEIFIRRETTSYSEDQEETDVDIFVRSGGKIISCSSKVLPRVQELEKYLPRLEVSKRSLEDKGLDVDEVLGPAFLLKPRGDSVL